MASSTLDALTGEAPALTSLFYHVKSPFSSGDDRKGTGLQTTQGLKIPRMIYAQGLPMIKMSSATATGSPTGTGAFTSLTAIPDVPPAAYCWFPAGANVDGANTAGWYYCTFSSTTAGTVYNNPYTPSSTPPTIPGSPTAPTTLTTWTGDTGAVTIASFVISGGSLGANGYMHIPNVFTSQTSNGNSKIFTLNFGALVKTVNVSGSANQLLNFKVSNTGSAAAQVGSIGQFSAAGTAAFGTVDTASDVTVTLTITAGTATDNVVVFGIAPMIYSTGS